MICCSCGTKEGDGLTTGGLCMCCEEMAVVPRTTEQQQWHWNAWARRATVAELEYYHEPLRGNAVCAEG